MSVSDTFFAEKNTWVSSAKHFLSNKKETTDFTVYLRNSTNPIVSLTLRQAIRFSFSIADQQLCKLLLAICPFRQPNIIITASHFICQPLPGKSSRQIPAATTFSYGTFGSKSAYPCTVTQFFPIRNHSNVITSEDNPACSRMSRCSSFKSDARRI